MNKKLLLLLMSLFLTFTEMSLAQVIEETNINVGISIQKSYFLLFDGSTISYNFQIYNPNNYTIENLDLQFELRSTDAGRIFFENKHIPIIRPNQIINYSTDNYQLTKIGLYNLFISGKSNYISIKIGGVKDENFTRIRDTFRVYPFSISGLIAIIALFISAAGFYNNHLKNGEILVSLPRFLRVHKSIGNNLLITIPLVLENTGAYSKSVSNLGLVIQKKDTKYFLELHNEYEKFLWNNDKNKIEKDIIMDKNLKPATQFTIPPKTSITKIFMFGNLNIDNFKEDNYIIKLICWENSSEYNQTLLEFKNKIKKNGIIDILDVWKTIYKKEAEIHPFKKFYYKRKYILILRFKNYFVKYNHKIKKFFKRIYD